ncbi:MAG: acetyl-CoA carboxylase biotin carboxyl carrier protein subunit [Chlorobiaceae bacterium]|nr:acetyl-CoA carboxylase biotin carboxyl carrier protein subunit [Chlorobiaceae bacterium]
MKNYKFTINGNTYEVTLHNIEDNIAEIEVNGTNYTVEIDRKIQTPKTPKLVRKAEHPSTDSEASTLRTAKPTDKKGGGVIKSPLPGVILDIFIREGDIVKEGQKLIILEAMKMENNINSDKEGKVRRIHIKQGDSVLEGDVLIEIGD